MRAISLSAPYALSPTPRHAPPIGMPTPSAPIITRLKRNRAVKRHYRCYDHYPGPAPQNVACCLNIRRLCAIGLRDGLIDWSRRNRYCRHTRRDINANIISARSLRNELRRVMVNAIGRAQARRRNSEKYRCTMLQTSRRVLASEQIPEKGQIVRHAHKRHNITSADITLNQRIRPYYHADIRTSPRILAYRAKTASGTRVNAIASAAAVFIFSTRHEQDRRENAPPFIRPR